MDKTVREKLERPFDRKYIKQRKVDNRNVDYVTIQAVTGRLNEAFESEWSFAITDTSIMDTEVVVRGRLTACGVSKEAFGGTKVTYRKSDKTTRVSLTDDLKAAEADCIKKCASFFGIALDLYGEIETAADGAREESAGVPDTDKPVCEAQGEAYALQDLYGIPGDDMLEICARMYQKRTGHPMRVNGKLTLALMEGDDWGCYVNHIRTGRATDYQRDLIDAYITCTPWTGVADPKFLSWAAKTTEQDIEDPDTISAEDAGYLLACLSVSAEKNKWTFTTPPNPADEKPADGGVKEF